MGRCAVCSQPGLRQAWTPKRRLDPTLRQMCCLNGHTWYEVRRVRLPRPQVQQ
mgnify:CR=1 FL=1